MSAVEKTAVTDWVREVSGVGTDFQVAHSMTPSTFSGLLGILQTGKPITTRDELAAWLKTIPGKDAYKAQQAFDSLSLKRPLEAPELALRYGLEIIKKNASNLPLLGKDAATVKAWSRATVAYVKYGRALQMMLRSPLPLDVEGLKQDLDNLRTLMIRQEREQLGLTRTDQTISPDDFYRLFSGSKVIPILQQWKLASLLTSITDGTVIGGFKALYSGVGVISKKEAESLVNWEAVEAVWLKKRDFLARPSLHNIATNFVGFGGNPALLAEINSAIGFYFSQEWDKVRKMMDHRVPAVFIHASLKLTVTSTS